MISDNRLAGFVLASLALHAAGLAWMDFSGAGPGRLPVTLSVLLEKGDAGQGAEGAPAQAPAPQRPRREHDEVVAEAPPAGETTPSKTPAPARKLAAPEPAAETPARAAPTTRTARALPEPQPAETTAAVKAAPVARAAASESSPVEVDEPAESARDAAPARTAAAEPAPGAAAQSAAATAPAGHGELLSLLHRAISREQRYPSLALRQRREGTTTVSFNLSPLGDMDAIEVDRSSGFGILDTAAVTAVSRVAPFSPAKSYLSDVTRFRVDVTFRLMN